ncbi:MAG: HlyD family secretion protein, partial [Alphaproteobacteria bacterium]
TASAQVGGTNRALAASRKARLEAERRLELSRLGELEIEASRRKVAERAGQVEEARRALQLAEIELAYTEVVAPFSGIVARRWHHRGDYAHVGEPLFSLYDPSLVYVTANVPEDLLRGVAPGNPAKLDVIAWDKPFRGRVLWVGSATDAKFSLIPRDVSAGEFTWVVQRVPVRIWFEPDERFGELRPGLSVTAGIEHGPGDPAWAKATLDEEARLEQLRTKAALEASERRRTSPAEPATGPAAGLPAVAPAPAPAGDGALP